MKRTRFLRLLAAIVALTAINVTTAELRVQQVRQRSGDSRTGSRHGPRPKEGLAATEYQVKKTTFDAYLEEQLRDPEFAARFKEAGEAWDVSLPIAALREKAGLSQKELAERLKTSQQQISRLESPGYEGHSLSMLRRVARVLNARIRLVFEPAAKRAGAGRAARIARFLPHETKIRQENMKRAASTINSLAAELVSLKR